MPQGPIAAFFDMDLTVIAVNSGSEWVKYLRRKGQLTRWGMIKAMSWIARYKLALIDLHKLTEQLVADQAGKDEESLRNECVDWAARHLTPTIFPRAREVIAKHRDKGHHIVLLTSSSPYASEPLAAALDIAPKDVLCTRLGVEDGKFTGKVVSPVCAGAGKVTWAERWAEAHGVHVEKSWFYTDSYNDLPMLVRAGHPVVVNPDVRLAREARRRGWPIEIWPPGVAEKPKLAEVG